MNLYIPSIGESITLSESWTFTLFAEIRNDKLAELYGYYYLCQPKIGDIFIDSLAKAQDPGRNPPVIVNSNKTAAMLDSQNAYHDWKERYDEYVANAIKTCKESIIVTFPIDTILTIDRIYIRKGAKEFDSVSFFALLPTQSKKIRFWAKLSDVNKIVFNK